MKLSGLSTNLHAIGLWFQRLSAGKKLLVLGVVVIVVLLLYRRITASKQNQPQYQTAQVTRGDVISTLTESGNVSAGGETNVTSPTDGIIEEIYVKNGDEVSVGQNLFKVKSTATPQQQASAYASYLSAVNSLNTAKSKMDSLQSALFKANQAFVTDKGVGTPSDAQKADPRYIEENADWLQAQADYTNQQGIITQAQAALTSAAFAYAATQDSVVTAPVNGTVANLSASIGSGVTASSTVTTTSNNSTSTGGNAGSGASTTSSSGGSTVLVIGDFSQLQIKVQVSEVDMPNVHPGQKATITLDAFPDKTFVGSVESIDTIGTNSSGVVTYNAYITVIAPPSDIHPGMTASAVIQTDRHDNVLSVPTSAVQTTNGQSYVRVLKNGKLTQIPVEVGLASDTDTEITSGLTEGQTVVTSIVTPSAARGSAAQSASPFSGLGGRGGFGGGGAVIRRGGGGG